MTQPWEIENFLEVRDGQLHVSGVNAVELAREHGTPLFVFSESRIRHNIDRLKKAADVIDCPLKLCYAAKANSTMAILRTVKEAGSDIEVNSGGELWKALKIGFTGDQIIFNGTSKEVWELENAINADIYAIQVDSLFELSLIEETAKRLGKKANVSLRLVPEIETGTHSGLQTALLTSKFGMMPDEAFSAFHTFRDSPHLDLCGIHLHIGSQNPDPIVYSEALALLFDSMLRIFTESGIRLKHINLGGGFPVNYLSDNSLGTTFPAEQREMFSADFEPVDAIRHAWSEVKAGAVDSNTSHLLENFSLLLEPGRSVISDAGICLTTVRNKKQRPVSGSSLIPHPSSLPNDVWLLTDAGFNILLSMETYKWYYHLISAERTDKSHSFPYKVAGPLCDGGDVYFDIEGENRLPPYRLLPKDVQPGEVLALLNCGAYSLAQASQYNGRFLPPVVLIRDNGEAELIRKRDGFADLLGSDLF
ncbi:MAG: diaminopimelate decarboxylase [Pyrinomonadaceae bacterium]